MAQKYYSVLTSYGLDLVNQHVLNGAPFILNDWHIAAGTGALEPTVNTTALVNKIFDKNSANYPGITIGTDETYGRYAQIVLPSSLEGNIITELGLFDGEGNLIIAAKCYEDMTEGITSGLVQTRTERISLAVFPSNLDVLYINESNYATVEDIEEHFVRQDGTTAILAEQKGVEAESDDAFPILSQVKEMIDAIGETVLNTGNVTGSHALTLNKHEYITIAGNTTLVLPTSGFASGKLNKCVVWLKTGSTLYNIIQPTGSNIFWVGGNTNKPNIKYKNATYRLEFVTIDGGTNWVCSWELAKLESVVFSDNFARSDTYTTARSTESADGNGWYAWANSTASQIGIKSGALYNYQYQVGQYISSYRRNAEDYSEFIDLDLEFDFSTASGSNQDGLLGVYIGSNTVPTTSYVLTFCSGISFKTDMFYKTIGLYNGSTQIATASFNFTTDALYRIKIFVDLELGFIGLKIWLKGTDEPTSYTLQYTGDLSTVGSYLMFATSHSESGAGYYNNVDNVDIVMNK